MNCTRCNDAPMTHTNHKGTHIYVCETCPNVSFEYCNQEDMDNLQDYAKGLE